ncbi:pantoate--beta-alanine ligase [Gynuella sunshinyii]|uniref:Pantothenate synthetase n=1 Tax=Gynuella sunshinyii YC6258 TaxID=1445510 RepID=A0A0C5VRL3_9GAMM|nr:pantoate--beta-alanine ligase [Gynuella sunshinyii]AJQ97247.1 panthothenate synthetase [Gynuella sunshinyii YC6258]
MKTVASITELRALIREFKRAHKTIAFVPTMGNLHSGHMRLVKTAREKADIVVSSIFVNPTQFGENEDLDAYPRTLEEDKKKLIAEGCDLLFTPNSKEMYPSPDLVRVITNHISTLHCGASRPIHFNGVTTVVAKFFNLVQPDYAVFGLKDFQQFTIIKMMVEELMMPIEMVGVDTGRADDGLAHSSRNNYLTADEREVAPTLYQVLQDTRKAILTGELDWSTLIKQAKVRLSAAGMTPDYFSICRQHDLEPANTDDPDLVILAAAYLGKARLIDNIHFSQNNMQIAEE